MGNGIHNVIHADLLVGQLAQLSTLAIDTVDQTVTEPVITPVSHITTDDDSDSDDDDPAEAEAEDTTKS